jgi:hypothetical protein
MEQKTWDPLRQKRNKDSNQHVRDTETHTYLHLQYGVLFLQLRYAKVLYNYVELGYWYQTKFLGHFY